MDVGIVVGISSLTIVFILFLWIRHVYQKKLTKVSDELKFFKKEKDHSDESMMILSKEYEIVFANQSAKRLFSLNEKNKVFGISKKIELQLGSDEPMDFFKALEKKNNTTKDNFHLNDAYIIVSDQKKKANVYIDKSRWNINQTITCVIDTNVQTETKDVSKVGSTDFLTGLPSQFAALSDINTLVLESQKKSESFAIFLLGIDHFNEIQATLGLNYTNKILKKMATYFEKNPYENVKVYHMEADKFLLLLKYVDTEDMARKIARKLVVDIVNYYKGNVDIHLTVSLGMVIYPAHGENATKLINHIYAVLNYAQKDSTSNIEFFTKEHQFIRKDEVKMNEEIRKGLLANQFLLYYQPIFDLKTEGMIGAEALIRWNHPEYGIISPDRFLDVAEKTGLIIDIGEYVFKEAIQDRKRWSGLQFKDFKVTINLSLREMQVDKLIEKLEALFETYEVDPKDFNLDISEDAAMSNIEKTVMDFKLFKKLGLSISLEHFGAGYSSLKHLQRLPLSMIKVDRSLIFDLSSNLEHQTTVKAIIELAHTLGFEVAAEGVETSSEVTILQGLKCNYAQGYLFSKPLPASEFQELLR